MKVTIPDHVLAQVPEEDREEFKKEIMEMLADPNFEHTPVQHLEGEAVCPHCKVALTLIHTTCLSDGYLVSFYDCPKCEKPFEGEAQN